MLQQLQGPVQEKIFNQNVIYHNQIKQPWEAFMDPNPITPSLHSNQIVPPITVLITAKGGRHRRSAAVTLNMK